MLRNLQAPWPTDAFRTDLPTEGMHPFTELALRTVQPWAGSRPYAWHLFTDGSYCASDVASSSWAVA
eukprot:9553643-Lingulodinium_polyedra.AAC.1